MQCEESQQRQTSQLREPEGRTEPTLSNPLTVRVTLRTVVAYHNRPALTIRGFSEGRSALAALDTRLRSRIFVG